MFLTEPLLLHELLEAEVLLRLPLAPLALGARVGVAEPFRRHLWRLLLHYHWLILRANRFRQLCGIGNG